MVVAMERDRVQRAGPLIGNGQDRERAPSRDSTRISVRVYSETYLKGGKVNFEKHCDVIR